MLHSYSTWNRKKITFTSGHYLCNLPVTDIGVFGYVDVINLLQKSGTFLLVQSVWSEWSLTSVLSLRIATSFMSEHFLGLNVVPFTSLFKTGLVTFKWFSVKNARGEESILILYEHLLPFRILRVVARFCLLSRTVFHARLVPLYLKTRILWLVEGCIGAQKTRSYSNVPVHSLWFLLLSLMIHVQAFGDITYNKWIISFVSTTILSIRN